jgi:hypothetical protein
VKVYAVEWCYCIYESGFSAISLHTTLKGAYSAMRKLLLEKWEEESKRSIHGQKLDAFDRQMLKRFQPLENERWRCKAIEVQDNRPS